jgi:hypothetical protein
MSEEDIVILLGEPVKREMRQGKQEIYYALERTQRQAFLCITFHDGYATGLSVFTTIS